MTIKSFRLAAASAFAIALLACGSASAQMTKEYGVYNWDTETIMSSDTITAPLGDYVCFSFVQIENGKIVDIPDGYNVSHLEVDPFLENIYIPYSNYIIDGASVYQYYAMFGIKPDVPAGSHGNVYLKDEFGNVVKTVKINFAVPYVDEDGHSRLRSDYTVVTKSTSTFASGGWYVVPKNTDIVRDASISVKGKTHLILCDGCELEVSGGSGKAGISAPKGTTLKIYGQSEMTGKLTAKGGYNGAGIGGDNSTSCGTVAIYGGIVSATGDHGAGIGGGCFGDGGFLIVGNGTVSAFGGYYSAGLGGGYQGTGGSVKVEGGKVFANGGYNAVGIGHGYSSTSTHGVLRVGPKYNVWYGNTTPPKTEVQPMPFENNGRVALADDRQYYVIEESAEIFGHYVNSRINDYFYSCYDYLREIDLTEDQFGYYYDGIDEAWTDGYGKLQKKNNTIEDLEKILSETIAAHDVVVCQATATVCAGTLVPVNADYDGDGIADIGIFDAKGYWYICCSEQSWRVETFGSASCVPVPADYDGDGMDDLSVYDTVTGDWFIRYSSGNWYVDNFGANTCIPLPADYDGDGTADLSVYDQQTGDWFVRYSKGGWYVDNFGSNGCIPVPADYDGDGKDDYSVYDQKTGDWWIRYSGGGWYVDNFGAGTCDPAPADHDGDGKADLAVYDQRTGDWFIRFSGGGWTVDNFGAWTCTPVPMDYDGDEKSDFAVLDNATKTFWIRYSGGGWTSYVF